MGFTSREDEILMAKKLTQLVKGKHPKIKASDGSCLDAVFLQWFFLYQMKQTKPFSKYQSKENDLPIKQEKQYKEIMS